MAAFFLLTCRSYGALEWLPFLSSSTNMWLLQSFGWLYFFFYSNDEFEIMKVDIEMCKQSGCDGVVIGLLKEDGSVDKKRCRELVALAFPLSVTFHRAFDRTKDPFRALEDIIETGCGRILTSGQQPKAVDGVQIIKELIA